MHYMIVIWNKEALKYDIVHYSHDFFDFDRMTKLYPREKGYFYLVELMYLKAHEVLERYKVVRENLK